MKLLTLIAAIPVVLATLALNWGRLGVFRRAKTSVASPSFVFEPEHECKGLAFQYRGPLRNRFDGSGFHLVWLDSDGLDVLAEFVGRHGGEWELRAVSLRHVVCRSCGCLRTGLGPIGSESHDDVIEAKILSGERLSRRMRLSMAKLFR